MKDDVLRKAQGTRLAKARELAGYRSARAAALENDWPESTYRAHEAGSRTIGQDDAERYSRRFRAAGVHVTAQMILFGGEPMTARQRGGTVPLVGYVGAGAAMNLFGEGQGPFDFVDAPEGATPETVAVEIRGQSLGELFDQWLVYYDDVHDPPTSALIGKLCVVGLSDNRVLVKKLEKGQLPGLFTLRSNTEPPIYDVAVTWAARVKQMTPR